MEMLTKILSPAIERQSFIFPPHLALGAIEERLNFDGD
jgi:hypothetical protein